MEFYIKINQDYHVEDCLAGIILEPDYYGIDDICKQKDLVIKKLMDLANFQAEKTFSLEQVTKVYERIICGDIAETIRTYYARNLAYYCDVCDELFGQMAELTHHWYLQYCRPGSQLRVQPYKEYRRQKAIFEDTMDCLAGITQNLQTLSKTFNRSQKRQP